MATKINTFFISIFFISITFHFQIKIPIKIIFTDHHVAKSIVPESLNIMMGMKLSDINAI
jgi:hypothetical protein